MEGRIRDQWRLLARVNLCRPDEILRYTVDIGHLSLAMPVFFRHVVTVMESLPLEMDA